MVIELATALHTFLFLQLLHGLRVFGIKRCLNTGRCQSSFLLHEVTIIKQPISRTNFMSLSKDREP